MLPGEMAPPYALKPTKVVTVEWQELFPIVVACAL